ncbi:MAG: molybdopterin molybdenumtransferase MoeA [Acidobacteria bacterium]|nr:MAG: molybdopterin molybdenumtransferase MoeA [Acidobacteriota bacterium]PYU46710.1 MAG: molybdopterin molybdenumtransferase MoeA [Acidobacteriota bacterium]PYU74834.1 MAG: molybdopterin molybdenumtransferase MoeA [Acidobacteriota bacterium]
MLSYEQARNRLIEEIGKKKGPRATAVVSVWDALGLVLAQEVRTDREYPPFDRSTRDGYALRSKEAGPGAQLKCVGEIKAGDTVREALAAGTCLQIMTGAAVPAGADAVVMIEHTTREGDLVRFERVVELGQNIVPRGSEAAAGQSILTPGMRLGYAELALAAQVGGVRLECAQRPRVAILSTGDEVVLIDESPGEFQIRNSNSVSLAAQVRIAGGQPVVLGNAADRIEDLGEKIERGLKEDALVLSGGVSMGKYDLVESVLKAMGAEFFFDAVAIRPGRPAVFGMCQGKAVFGLPGNPVSTMVTFELFVAPAIDLLSGAEARALPLVEARLAEALRERPGLTHFLPARVEWRERAPEVKALRWQGSGDIAALSRANCFLVVPADREKIDIGETVSVLLRKDLV